MERDISLMKQFKPNILEVIERYERFWNHEPADRILAHVGVPLRKVFPLPRVPDQPETYYSLTHGGEKEWKMIVAHTESVLQARKNLLDDYIPTVRPDLGPTITGAMLGFSEMKLAPGTSWAVPLLDTWDKLDQVYFDPDNKWFKRCVSLIDFMVAHAKGRYMVGLPDTHSTGDMMAACRGTVNLIKDLYTNPHEVDKLAKICTNALTEMLDALLERISHFEGGFSLGWMPLWAPGKGCVIQEDFAAFLSPEKYSELLRPHDQRIADYMNTTMFHTHENMTYLVPEMTKVEGLGAVQISAHGFERDEPYEPKVRRALEAAKGKTSIWYTGAANLDEVKKIWELFGNEGLMVSISSSSIDAGNKLLKKLKDL